MALDYPRKQLRYTDLQDNYYGISRSFSKLKLVTEQHETGILFYNLDNHFIRHLKM